MPLNPTRSLRIIYGCPVGDIPAGGVKVIYRHSELLNLMGQKSFIWHPGDDQFKCSWFKNQVETISDRQLNPATDLIVIPEIWATGYMSLLKNLGFKVAIFVQNGYYTHVNLNPSNPHGIRDAYASADLVLSISKDTSAYLEKILNVENKKIILQRYSVDPNMFKPGNKSKLISYMPRKMAQHSARFVPAITPALPAGWAINPLDQMSEKQVAQHLSQSIIFIAFSEFEGLPVPPVEAAMSGNIVIGYHGQGGYEYWQKPNFIEVEQGNIQRLISETLQKIDEIESGKLDLNELNKGMNLLSQYFSKTNEELMLQKLIENSNLLFKKK